MTASKKTRRFFSETPLLLEGQVVYLQPEETRHIQQTLRLNPGDEVRVTDGLGHDALAVISSFEDDHRTSVTLKEIFKGIEKSCENGPGLSLKLFAAFAAKGIMDELVEKGQELGVAAFYPLSTERTVVSLSAEKEGKVLERWYKITRESAKQSGNAKLMRVHKPMSFEDALRQLLPGEETLLFHPSKKGRTLADWLKHFREKSPAMATLNLFIGPEGGFSEREVAGALKLGDQRGVPTTVLSLGPSILRVSTAVVAAVGALKYS